MVFVVFDDVQCICRRSFQIHLEEYNLELKCVIWSMLTKLNHYGKIIIP